MFLKNLAFLSAKCTFMCSQLHRGLRSSFIVHFTSITSQKTPGRSTVRDFYVEFDFLGLGCDHAVLEQLEAKNLSKRATCCQKQPIFGGFWLLAALEQHGCTPHLKNRILHEYPERQTPMESLGEWCQQNYRCFKNLF